MQIGEKKKNREKTAKNGETVSSFKEKIKDKLKEKDEREVRARLSRSVELALVVAAAYLIGGAKLFFATYPISIALACSSRRRLFGVALGLSLCAITTLHPYYTLACISVILLRALTAFSGAIIGRVSESDGSALIKYNKNAVGERNESVTERKGAAFDKLFCESLHIRLLISAVGGFLCGLFFMIEGDFSFYSLYQTVVLTFVAPLGVICLGGLFGEDRYSTEIYKYISEAAVVFLSVLASLEMQVLGMPLSPCLAMLFTLYFSSRGVIFGLCAAFLCGAAFSFLYIPLLMLSAILFCLVSAVKKNAGVAAVCALCVVWCYYIGGESGLISVLPPMLLSIPIYMLSDRYREMMKMPMEEDAASNGLYFAEAVTEKSKNEAVRERLEALSEVFDSLSETFYELSDRYKRPDALGIRRITDSAFERVCSDCRDRERCWGADHGLTIGAIGKLTSSVHTKGIAVAEDLPSDFLDRCHRCDRIIREVNLEAAKCTEKVFKGGKMNFFAANYDEITALLKDALGSDSEEYECYGDEGGRIFELLKKAGVALSGVVVYGKRCRHVVAKRVSGHERLSASQSAELSREIGKILNSEMSEPYIEVGKDGSVLQWHSRPKINAVCAHGRVSRCGSEWASDGAKEQIILDPFDEEECCGDVTNAFITDNSYFYALINDGMGSGAEAAYISGVCSMFIEKMLLAGNKADITLRMLNNVIRNENMGCGRECSSTVDLMELDLMNGVASFIKSGAAPTYVARGGTVYKISSRTMPVGIIKDADTRITKFDTKKGDIIIMMSDGCCHDSDDCPWLVEYLCALMKGGKIAIDGRSSESIKNDIVSLAIKNAPTGAERDDISVSVTLVG